MVGHDVTFSVNLHEGCPENKLGSSETPALRLHIDPGLQDRL